MKKIIIALSFFLAGISSFAFSLKAIEGKTTRVEPVYISKIQTASQEKSECASDYGGLVFYFEFSKSKKNNLTFVMEELRDFFIDNTSYQEYTKEKLGETIEPETTLMESYKLINQIPAAKNIVKNKKDGMIMKTIIYGAKLPEEGTVTITVKAGWGKLKAGSKDAEVEEFTFTFNLGDL